MSDRPSDLAASPTLETVLRHRSIRHYEDRPIPDEAFRSILAAAQMAASSSHKQAYSVVAVFDPVVKAALAEVASDQEWVRECAIFLVWCADLHRIRVALEGIDAPMVHENIEEFLIATIDATLAAQTAFVAAESLGIGGVYIGGLRNDPARVTELLGLPKLVYPVFGMCLGYPAEDPWIKPRLPVELVYHEGRYDASRYVEGIAEYDDAMETYYRERTDGDRDTTWSREMAKKFRVSQRPHMRAFLDGQGFHFD